MKTRRDFIIQSLTLGTGVFLVPHYLPAASIIKPAQSSKKTIVVIFQRGAADALAMLSPVGDSNFNKSLRPNLFIDPSQMLKADSYFSFHPALGGFKSLWDRGLLTAVHQVGSPSNSRSHFDAQDFFESGTPDKKSTDDGFLARALPLLSTQPQILALSVQPALARMIAGSSKSVSFSDLSKFSVRGLGSATVKNAPDFEAFFDSALEEVLNGRHENSSQILNDFGKAQDYKLSDKWQKAQLKGPLAPRLRDIAKIIKSDMNIPFIVTESGGWDTHNNQGAEQGQLANRLKEFSDTIYAFVEELGPKISDVTVVVVSEFGRTARENGSRGTDHGHGSCYYVIGGGLKPKSVHTNWLDLKKQNLFEERDLPVTTDYREVFSNLLNHQFGLKDFSQVFPNWTSLKKLNLFS